MGDAAVQACGAAPKWRWGAEKERSSCSGAAMGDAAVQGRFDGRRGCERRRQQQRRRKTEPAAGWRDAEQSRMAKTTSQEAATTRSGRRPRAAVVKAESGCAG
ncbi:hypothetical protein ACOSQ2_012291 [Xanthoceras sorbifolium]